MISFSNRILYTAAALAALALASVAKNSSANEPSRPNPFLAPTAASNMHGDSGASDTHAVRGPESAQASIRKFKYGRWAGECAGFAFDRHGRIVTVCVKALHTEIVLLDPESLEAVARHRIPRRKGAILAALTFQLERLFGDTSGGSYFYLDHRDRAVVATSDRRILIVAIHDGAGGPELRREAEFDLNGVVPGDCKRIPGKPDPRCDKVTTAMPDYQGLLWFVTRAGRIGTLDLTSGRIAVIQVAGEQIQNSFSVGEDGTYIVTDHALYRLQADPGTGRPRILWRETYDRGSHVKPGQLSQGSGTTPTLLGTDYVAIADNAEPRMNVLVYRRDDAAKPRLVCQVPVFEPGRSATENSFVGFQDSLIVENNYGYLNPFARNNPAGGLARIDVHPDGCAVAWTSPEISPSTVAKLSTVNGLLYTYTLQKKDWSLTAIDFKTGQTRFSVPVGRGRRADNSWGSIVIGPREGQACVGLFSGMTCIYDR